MIKQSLCFSVRSCSSLFLKGQLAHSFAFWIFCGKSTRYTHIHQRRVQSIKAESWQDHFVDAAIEEANAKDRTQLVRISLYPKSFGDSRSVSTTYHASWLWSNDPTYTHAGSGQRTRSVVSFFSNKARIHSVKIAIPDSNSISANVEVASNGQVEALPSVQPIPPPPGSLHPIGGVYATSKNDLHANLAVSDLDQALLQVVWITAKGFIVSFYDVSWLIRCRYDDWARAERDQTWEFDLQLGQKSEIVGEQVNFQAYQYSDLFIQGERFAKNDEKSDASTFHCFRLLHSIVKDGAALLRNANNPYDDNPVFRDDKLPVAIVGKLLSGGQLSHGQLYGDVFHVRDQDAPTERSDNHDPTPAAKNIAYTSMALCPHQDLAYYESIPGLQLLHCITNDPESIVGGESTLIDVLKAAEQFRILAPTLFDILVKCEATFIKQRDDADMIYRRAHVVLSSSSGAVTSVRWSPPFEGPLFLPSTLVDEYFLAYAAFERMLDNSLPRYSAGQLVSSSGMNIQLIPQLSSQLESELCDYAHECTWEYRLKPGEILVFNNQRMLHGRRAYSVRNHLSKGIQTKGRHLIGCYTNIDDTLNKYRVLRRHFFRDRFRLPYERVFGNGSSHNF